MSPGDTLDVDMGRNKVDWCHLSVLTDSHSVCVLFEVKIGENY